MTGWNIVLWLHLLAVAYFIGGQLMLASVVVPVMRDDENRDKLRAAARRFGVGSLVAFGVLIVTGAMMAGHFNLWSNSQLHLKLGLFVLMLALLAIHTRLPQNHALEGIVFLISLAIMWLGVLIAN